MMYTLCSVAWELNGQHVTVQSHSRQGLQSASSMPVMGSGGPHLASPGRFAESPTRFSGSQPRNDFGGVDGLDNSGWDAQVAVTVSSHWMQNQVM